MVSLCDPCVTKNSGHQRTMIPLTQISIICCYCAFFFEYIFTSIIFILKKVQYLTILFHQIFFICIYIYLNWIFELIFILIETIWISWPSWIIDTFNSYISILLCSSLLLLYKMQLKYCVICVIVETTVLNSSVHLSLYWAYLEVLTECTKLC